MTSATGATFLEQVGQASRCMRESRARRPKPYLPERYKGPVADRIRNGQPVRAGDILQPFTVSANPIIGTVANQIIPNPPWTSPTRTGSSSRVWHGQIDASRTPILENSGTVATASSTRASSHLVSSSSSETYPPPPPPPDFELDPTGLEFITSLRLYREHVVENWISIREERWSGEFFTSPPNHPWCSDVPGFCRDLLYSGECNSLIGRNEKSTLDAWADLTMYMPYTILETDFNHGFRHSITDWERSLIVNALTFLRSNTALIHWTLCNIYGRDISMLLFPTMVSMLDDLNFHVDHHSYCDSGVDWWEAGGHIGLCTDGNPGWSIAWFGYNLMMLTGRLGDALCPIIWVAGLILHELVHRAGLPGHSGDEGGECHPAYLLVNVFYTAALQRFPESASSPLCSTLNNYPCLYGDSNVRAIDPFWTGEEWGF